MHRLRRIATYFRVMFPLHVNLPALGLMFYGFQATAQATGGSGFRVGRESAYGFATVLLSYLLLRLVDELKDQGVDAEVFPDRPLVTGAVRYEDVRLLALLAILALALLNVGRGLATHTYFVWFVAFVLAWQWWLFPKRVSENVWLVFATHQPLVPLLFLYMYSVHVETTGVGFDPVRAAVLCGIFWLPMFAWEIARKVRAPEDETRYLSYTRRWGTRRAAAIPPLCIAAACAAMLGLGRAAGFSCGFAAAQLLIAALAIGVMGQFLVRPRRATLWVRAPMEAYIVLFYATALLEPALGGGGRWPS